MLVFEFSCCKLRNIGGTDASYVKYSPFAGLPALEIRSRLTVLSINPVRFSRHILRSIDGEVLRKLFGALSA